MDQEGSQSIYYQGASSRIRSSSSAAGERAVYLCDGMADSAGASAVVTADKFIMADGLDYRELCTWSKEDKCGGNCGLLESFRALLLLALIVTVSPSCERERKAEKPDRERPPQPKLQKMLSH